MRFRERGVTSSGFMRFVFQTPRAPACVMKTGCIEWRIVSIDVTSPECETSIDMPTLFIRSTA
jgi:hypothetical protein